MCGAALLFCPQAIEALPTSITSLSPTAHLDGAEFTAHGTAAVWLETEASADDTNEEDNDDDDQALDASSASLTTETHASNYGSTTCRALRRSAGQISVRAPPQ